MKRLLSVFLVILCMSGCGGESGELNTVLHMREQLQCSNCTFRAVITADYVDEAYEFTMDCQVDEQGRVSFTVVQPKTIAGITGSVGSDGGKLTFDSQVLAFETLADGLVTPVSAPWLMIKTLRGGYITAAGKDGENIHAVINDSYEEQALQLDFWMDENGLPKYCEVLWQGRRILSVAVENFLIV